MYSCISLTWHKRQNARNPFSYPNPKIKYLPDAFDASATHIHVIFIFSYFLRPRLLVAQQFRLMNHSFCNTFLSYYCISDYYYCCYCCVGACVRVCVVSRTQLQTIKENRRCGRQMDSFGSTRNCTNERALHFHLLCYVNVCVPCGWLVGWLACLLVTLVYLSRRHQRFRIILRYECRRLVVRLK